ncbi:MAG TPA: YbdD/YjiX family protein [Gemmatimonadaceae bacterium]|jgi:uncharacterized short protein YbdD (DUF466 family)|nr:YbdD/YjiX family protein [Gemmatimonadaceae bacterium]HSC32030.1 YbdD/YjiX family protein [Gemmatimonadaceae bacterium]
MTARSLGARIAAASRVVRAIVGAPDYERYLAHMRRRHPAQRPLTRNEFVRERMRDRYEKPGSRCC